MKKAVFIPIIAVALVLVVGVGTLFGNALKNNSGSDTASVSPFGQPAAPPPPAADTKYKDGTYTASGSYVSPGGNESINVKITVKSNNITAVTVTPQGGDPRSQEYETAFAQGIGQIVTGKPLASQFDVSEVNGSSLTGEGFTQALNAIRSQAQA